MFVVGNHKIIPAPPAPVHSTPRRSLGWSRLELPRTLLTRCGVRDSYAQLRAATRSCQKAHATVFCDTRKCAILIWTPHVQGCRIARIPGAVIPPPPPAVCWPQPGTAVAGWELFEHDVLSVTATRSCHEV